MEEKVQTFLDYLRKGYSRRKSFQQSGLTFSEWNQIFTKDLENQVKEIESEYQHFLEDNRDKDASIIYSPILDNYQVVDFNNKQEIEDIVYKTVMYQAITNPNNAGFAKNAIQLMIKNQLTTEPKKEEFSHITYLDFVKKANYPKPYPKQVEMVNFANETGNKLILAARKYGKTDYLTILNVAHKIKTIPNYTCMVITKEESRGRSICGAIKQACIDNGVEFAIKSSEELRVKGHFGKEHSLIVVPVGGTAYRGHHVDEIILDDPVVPSDKTSPASRQRTIDLYNELVNLSPNILVIGQPVHKNDLYSVLRESNIETGGEIKVMELPYGTIPELDTDLVRLRKQGVSEEAIGANYLLKLRSEGTLPFGNVPICPNDSIFNPDGEHRKKYGCEMWIDPAKRVSGRDYTAVSLNMITDDYINILGFAFRGPWSDYLAELLYLQSIYEPDKVMFELNGLGEDSILRLKEWGIKAIPFDTRENKEKKISSASLIADNLVLNNYIEVEDSNFIVSPRTGEKTIVHLIEPNKTFNKLFKDYEYGLADDPVDTTSSFLLARGVIRVKV